VCYEISVGRGRNYGWGRRSLEGLGRVVYRGGWAGRLAYTTGLQGRLHVDRRTFRVPCRLAASPLRVAFASDLHAGPLTDPRLLDAAVRAIRDFHPHLVLLGGDYVTLGQGDAGDLLPRLADLDAPMGVLGVVGNHDLWLDDDAIVAALRQAGVDVLVNEFRRLAGSWGEVIVYGMDDPDSGTPKPPRPSPTNGELSLVLMHAPGGLGFLDGFRFHLAFCGHTHGGQIALPGGRPILLPPGAAVRDYPYGHFPLPSHDAELLVSRGVGFTDLPVRIFAPSEVHLCTIEPTGPG